MTYDEIVAEIPNLTAEERRRLFDVLLRSLQPANAEETGERRDPASFLKWAGALKTGSPSLTDEELKEEYVSYLEQKYS